MTIAGYAQIKLADSTIVRETGLNEYMEVVVPHVQKGEERLWVKSASGWTDGVFKVVPIDVIDVVVDPTTELKLGPTQQVTNTQVTRTYTKRNLDAGELDRRKDQVISGIPLAFVEGLFKHENEIRALKTPPESVLTRAAFINWLKTKLGA